MSFILLLKIINFFFHSSKPKHKVVKYSKKNVIKLYFSIFDKNLRDKETVRLEEGTHKKSKN